MFSGVLPFLFTTSLPFLFMDSPPFIFSGALYNLYSVSIHGLSSIYSLGCISVSIFRLSSRTQIADGRYPDQDDFLPRLAPSFHGTEWSRQPSFSDARATK